MKRKEWVVLALVIAAVAALEVFGTGDGSSGNPYPEGAVQEAPRAAEATDPSEPTSDPMAAYRTVRLHVTGMT
ncbi:MAG: hypothetical protein ACN0LA_08870 [Candidatus Longimicrobiales bacterium M2_2A_002]